MPLVTVRPGVHTATYGSVALGETTADGYRLRYRNRGIPINNTGSYGDSLIDGIHRGMSNVQVIATFKEMNVSVEDAMYPMGTTPNTLDGILGEVGELWTTFALPIVITPAAGSPALANRPAASATTGVITLHACLLASDNDVEFLFGAVETDVTLVFDVLLTDQSAVKRFWTWA